MINKQKTVSHFNNYMIFLGKLEHAFNLFIFSL